ncbi:MAG: hypothetical protein J0H12_03970 [Candidatus Paracaedimonas acanthamoebae]|jgi:hypothetical protein|uniref:YtkA-like domain-containing protein n=1 Tax=Candidatus Paracaedimonas acanthamoebae TaxID=244581 RepID=A0A8J7PJ01_9PROT|nr:hypothetical protein [Candidatus Paracaedimonas acanthamoebae]
MKKLHTYLNSLGVTLGILSLTPAALSHEGESHKMASDMKMNHCSHEDQQEPTIKVDVLLSSQAQKDKIIPTRIKLTSIKDHKEVLLTDLKEVHTEKIHILIFDQTLTDYQHVHPTPTKEPGVYEFRWTPKNEGTYKIWVDIVPLNTGKEEYISTNLATVGNYSPAAEKKLSLDEKIGNNLYSLAFETKELKKGQAAMGKIKVLNKEGKDVKDLEPIMGAFAHIVAINEDFKTIAHVHPMGKEPTDEKERGGPELMFHFMPEKSGFYKIWLQIKLAGEEIFVPFGVNVN